MNKTFKLENNKLYVIYEFTEKHLKTLLIIINNDGCAEFENRHGEIIEDVDGNLISWQICDELVNMGLLYEDEEAFDVFYEINSYGKEIIVNTNNKICVNK